LLIPFPYAIAAECFAPDRPAAGHRTLYSEARENRNAFFNLTPKWLDAIGPDPAARGWRLAQFVNELVRQADGPNGTTVNGVVLPEFALDIATARALADELARTRLEFLITGFCDDRGANDSRNGIVVFLFGGGRVIGDYVQHKHHRWKLDAAQVINYGLDGRLNPTRGVYWWEKMTIFPRECHFVVFRPGACMAVLDCEDLGRIEPVQQAIRSVGANLVVCLLLDGAQIERRWPNRYAMVLADDPGSSVLTLTSLGMIRRYPKQKAPYEIGLWKERDGNTQELKLDHGSHGLLLYLWPDSEVNFSMDGRSDFGGTVKLAQHGGVRQVKHPEPPDWAKFTELSNQPRFPSSFRVQSDG
jgi:hypothetical protein